MLEFLLVKTTYYDDPIICVIAATFKHICFEAAKYIRVWTPSSTETYSMKEEKNDIHVVQI